MARRYTGGFLSAKEQATDSNTANGVFTLAEAQEKTALGNFPTGRWTPQRSLRFRSSASAYLSRTMGTPTNSKIWTWSGWIKIGMLGRINTGIFSAATSGSNTCDFFYESDQFRFEYYTGTTVYKLNTSPLIRDPSAWYHVVLVFDTTQTISTDRIKMYLNGSLITAIDSRVDPSLNYASGPINTAIAHTIGYKNGSNYFDGHLSELVFVDGQALDPSYFGFTDQETGTWVPKRYTGTYGNNGFYLPFSDNGSTTSLGFNYANTGNRLVYSEQFDNASWTKSGLTVTANAAVAPDSNTTADKLVPSTTPGVDHLIYETPNIGGGVYTFSVYAKAAGYNYIALRADDSLVGHIQVFDLANGVVNRWDGQYTNSVTSAKIESVGNGWYRCSMTFTASGAMVNAVYYPLPSQTNTLYAGDGTSGVYVWGAQLNVGNTLGSYVVTTSSGVTNDWTPNNISLTAGSTYDSMVDVPGIAAVSSQKDVGGVTRGNYCTFNPLVIRPDASPNAATFSEANLKATFPNAGGNVTYAPGTQEISSGKFYWEITINALPNNVAVGIGTQRDLNGNANDLVIYINGGGIYKYGTLVTTGASYTTNDVLGIAYDATNATISFYKNNVLQGTVTTLGISPCFPFHRGSTNDVMTGNFGQRPFTYTPPAGFLSVCTTNLPNPLIKNPSDHFDVKTWTGNGVGLQVGTTSKQSSAVQIPYSLRFKDNTSGSSTPTYLEYNPAAVTTSSYTWSFSVWIKRGKIGYSYPWILSADNNTGNADGIRFTNTDQIDWIVGGSQVLKTTQSFKTQEWNHFLFVWDTTQSSAAERQRIYVNGSRVNSLAVANYVSQNTQSKINLVNYLHRIGTTATTTTKSSLNTEVFDGYMAEVNFIDNQAKSPADFGQFDVNNNWIPKTYTGTYGISGYYLPFKAPSSFDSNPTYSLQFVETQSQYLSVATGQGINNFGTGDFAIEGWFNFDYNPDYTGQLVSAGDGNNAGAYYWQYYSGQLQFGIQATGQITAYSWTPAWGQWYHLAVTRSGSTVRQFINGVLVSSASSSQNFVDGPTWIGNGGAGYFAGLMSNVRIVKGSAVYTSSFTPSTSALTAISGTRLLTCQSSTIADNSGNSFSITANGSFYSPTVDYPWAKGVFSDWSGNNNHVANISFATSAPTVLTYATPGTYTWTAPAGVTSVDVLVVAGGGGAKAGGGGGGGVIYNTSYAVTPSTGYTVTVGAGGTANASNGSNSVFATLTAIGGGFGASDTSVGNGGSGGGGYYGRRSDGLVFGPYPNGTGTAGQGFAGGNYTATGNPPSSSYAVGGGGGGAGGAGFTNNGWTGGNGGPGRAVAITGVTTYYGGGGGGLGGYAAYGGIGGTGGGGSGNGSGGGTAQKGVDGTGGGGGAYQAGGSGIVILKYNNAYTYTGNGANAFNNQDNSVDTITDFTDTVGQHGSYAVMADYAKGSNVTVANGGRSVYIAAGATGVPATFSVKTGKWYWEVIPRAQSGADSFYISVVDTDNFALSSSNQTTMYNSAYLWTYYGVASGGSGQKGTNGSSGWTTYGSPYTVGDVIGVALDMDAGTLTYYKNGTSQGVAFTGFAGKTIAPALCNGASTTTVTMDINFGQVGFVYAPPSGFKPLNTKNLKDVGSYNLPDTFGNYVNTPDLVWMKSRSNTTNHVLYDTVRGVNQTLSTSSTNAQSSSGATALQAFLPNGYRLGADNSDIGSCNNAGYTYTGWAWNRGQTPGFDIVTYGGNGTGGNSIEHKLGVAPAMIIIKNMSSAGTNWPVYHKSLTAVNNTSVLYLNDTTYPGVITANLWNSTPPGNSYFTVGDTSAVNASGSSYVAYLWAEVPGFSKFGSYVGNGSSGGPFVYTGFRPKWIMIKSTTAANNWCIYDVKRPDYNPTRQPLYSNSTAAEPSLGITYDILSNGFKLREGGGQGNDSGQTYIYAAFAETPFKYANAR